MAQTIKIKRGGVGNIASLTLSTGEIALATGSLAAGIAANPFIVAGNSGNTLPVGAILTGSSTPSVNAKLNGALFYNSTDKQLIRLDSTGNQNLDIAATVENPLTIGAGLFGTSFDGSAAVTISVNSGSIAINDLNGTLSVANGGTGQTSLDDIVGDTKIIVSNGADTIIGGNVTLSLGGGVVSGSAQIAINSTTGTLNVSKGGTGATSLTDHGVLVGSGTSAITALSVGSNGQLLIGQTGADPSFNTVSGVISINNTGTTTFTATANTAISGAFTSTSASIAANIATNTSNIATNTSNIATLTAATSSYLTSSDLAGVVSSSVLSSPSQGTVRLATNGVNNDVDTGLQVSDSPTFSDLTLTGGDLIASTATTFNVFNTTATTVNAFGAATSITIGASTGTATIRNATINLGETSGDIVNIKGNLNVAGTTTTIDSTTVNIGDRIIELNAGSAAGDGGILVRDTNGSQTGSLLWDTAGNYWKSGLATDGVGGGTLYRIPEFVSTTNITDNTLIVAGTSGRLEGSGKFTEDATNGIVAAPKFTGLVGSNINGAGVLIIEPTSNEVASVTTEGSDELAHIFGTKTDGTLVFSNLIDGGTF